MQAEIVEMQKNQVHSLPHITVSKSLIILRFILPIVYFVWLFV